MVWHFAVIDGDLELSLSGLGRVNPELGRLTHDPIPDVRHADQGGIVHLEQRNKGQTKVLVIRCELASTLGLMYSYRCQNEIFLFCAICSC